MSKLDIQARNNNTYLQITNDANYLVTSKQSEYCLKCGAKIEFGRFCDVECKREFYSEVNRDLNGFED